MIMHQNYFFNFSRPNSDSVRSYCDLFSFRAPTSFHFM